MSRLHSPRPRTTTGTATLLVSAVAITMATSLLLLRTSAPEVQTATGGITHEVMRQQLGGWYEFDRPDEWYVDDSQHGPGLFSHQSGDESTGTRAALAMHDNMGAFEAIDLPLPPGTVTQTLAMPNSTAYRYVLPLRTDPVTAAGAIVDVVRPPAPPPSGGGIGLLQDPPAGFFMDESIVGFTDEADRVAFEQILLGIETSLQFIPDRTATLVWAETVQSPSMVLGLTEHAVTHPQGWTAVPIGMGGSQIFVSGSAGMPMASGTATLTITPGQPAAVWDDAEIVLGGDVRIRHTIGSRYVVNGVVHDQFVVNFTVPGSAPATVDVTLPDLPFGSPTYWLYEQTLWRIMWDMDLVYVPGSNGYPAP